MREVKDFIKDKKIDLNLSNYKSKSIIFCIVVRLDFTVKLYSIVTIFDSIIYWYGMKFIDDTYN